MRTRIISLVIATVALLVPATLRAQIGPSVMDGYGPLSEAQQAILDATRPDPPAAELLATEKRLQGRHYVTCDEWNLSLFKKHIENLGGAYAGVGTDQAYLFLGWQRPHIAFLFDYDPWVVYLHHVYGVFFREAETAEEFLAFFEKENRKETRDLIQEKLKDHPEVKDIVRVFRKNRDYIGRRLKRVARSLRKKNVPSYLTDPEMYTFVRNLVLAGRVHPMVGNLLDKTGMLSFAETCRLLGVPMRVLYMSNAEGYWKYPQQFKDNFIGQFFDDKSVVLRTVAAKWTNGDYRYFVQKATNFQAWMKEEWVRSYREVVPLRELKGKGDIPCDYVDRDPAKYRPKDKD